MYKLTCYELMNEGAIPLPYVWKNGNKVYPYGTWAYDIKQLAKYRKDNINEPSAYWHMLDDKDYIWMGEPCKRCQVKEECDKGFPSWLQKLVKKFIR